MAVKWVCISLTGGKAAQNITQTMCGQPVRDITHITPIVTGVSGGAAMIAVITRILVAGGITSLDDLFALVALMSVMQCYDDKVIC